VLRVHVSDLTQLGMTSFFQKPKSNYSQRFFFADLAQPLEYLMFYEQPLLC